MDIGDIKGVYGVMGPPILNIAVLTDSVFLPNAIFL